MGRIPQSFIDELIARLDIVEVVSARTPLKPAGREHQGLCPFHDENTASFTVSPQKQFYHCFGCGAHGNAVGFVMEYDRLGFVDAVEELAKSVGLAVPTDALHRGDGSDELYAVMAAAETWYRQQLKNHDAAIDYLKRRGISGAIAKSYKIGFAPPGWDGLLGSIGSDRNQIRAMEQAGLLSRRSDGGHYDKFRDRIMFPIHDARGRAIAFGGRVLKASEGQQKHTPKYLNSPETPLFHKGRHLYGLYQARLQGHLQRLLVVEGYMDVVALAQFGLTETVATLGTATTPEHAETLFRAADEVVFCFDGDRAGAQAAIRAMQAVLPRLRDGRQARFLFLPEGEDPDSMIRQQGADAFRQRLAQAMPLSDQFFAHYEQQVNMSSLDGRARLVELARPALEAIPEGAFRDMMLERLGKRAQSTVVRRPAARSDQRSAPRAAQPSLVRQAIGSLIRQPALAEKVDQIDDLRILDRPGIPLLVELLQWSQAHPEAKTAHLLTHWQERDEHKYLVKLATDSTLLSESSQIKEEFGSALVLLRKEALAVRASQLRAKLELGISGLSREEWAELRRLDQQKMQSDGKKSS